MTPDDREFNSHSCTETMSAEQPIKNTPWTELNLIHRVL